MLESLRVWLGIFWAGCFVVGVPIIILLVLLRPLFKTWYVRWTLALVIWFLFIALLPSSHPTPDWRRLQFEAKINLEHLYPALLAYQKDHGGQWPVKFSELVPDYVSTEHIGWFYSRNTLGQISPAQKEAERDPSMIDQSGMFISLFGAGGMIAIANPQITKISLGLRWFQKTFVVILDTDGHVLTIPVEEYHQRFHKRK